jgi:hypothetical protein
MAISRAPFDHFHFADTYGYGRTLIKSRCKAMPKKIVFEAASSALTDDDDRTHFD